MSTSLIAPPSTTPSPTQLAAAACALSREDLGVYGILAHGHTPATVHERWIDAATAIINGTAAKRKLLIVAPPGHAKSTWLSLILPPWYLGNHSDHSVLFFTSSDTMARQFGGTVKDTLESNEVHAAVFPGNDARSDTGRGWSTDGLYLRGVPTGSKDPSYRALGYGAAVVGARAHGIILDDPLTQEQARSSVEQLKAKQYHDLTVDSRLHPDGWELAIMTRWHDNDLASHFAKNPEWQVLQLPALDEHEQALWPERFPVDWLKAKRASIGGSLFACIFQGDPSALGGAIFKTSGWFRPLPEPMPEKLVRVQFWDLAWSEKQTADYVAGVTLGYVPGGIDWYLLGVSRHRIEETGLAQHMADHILIQRPDMVGVEIGAFKQTATQQVITEVRRLLGSRFAVAVQGFEARGDKVTRARVPAAMAEAGHLYADRTAPWFPEFESEALSFPLGEHDDQVDGLSGASQMVVEHQALKDRARAMADMITNGQDTRFLPMGEVEPEPSPLAQLLGWAKR